MMEQAANIKNKVAVQRLCEGPKKLNELQGLMANMHKEKKLITGDTAD